MDATECSERTAREAREDGQQSKTAVMRGKGCISLEVARQLSFYFRCCGGEMHESEISCIVHTASRTLLLMTHIQLHTRSRLVDQNKKKKKKDVKIEAFSKEETVHEILMSEVSHVIILEIEKAV